MPRYGTVLTQLRYNSGVALLFRLELLLERGQTGEPHVGHLVLVLAGQVPRYGTE